MGDYVKVKINSATSGTLFGDAQSKVEVTKQVVQKTA
jgi:hypothetical protein